MKLHHLAFWTNDIKQLADFYQKHFEAQVTFRHQDGDFNCAFIRIFDTIHIEFMNKPKLASATKKDRVGHSHISIEVESKDKVIRLTDYFIEQGVPLEKSKVQYEDGFFETSVFDPDGNIIEIAYIDRVINPNV